MKLPTSLPYPPSSCCCEILSPSSQVFTNALIPSLNDPYGAVKGPSAELHEFRLSWLSQVNTAALRCIAFVVQEFINRTQRD